jgi:hypothetical protein
MQGGIPPQAKNSSADRHIKFFIVDRRENEFSARAPAVNH